MILTVLFMLVMIALGALAFSQAKPEAVTVRELGRAILFAAVLVLMLVLARIVGGSSAPGLR